MAAGAYQSGDRSTAALAWAWLSVTAGDGIIRRGASVFSMKTSARNQRGMA